MSRERQINFLCTAARVRRVRRRLDIRFVKQTTLSRAVVPRGLVLRSIVSCGKLRPILEITRVRKMP